MTTLEDRPVLKETERHLSQFDRLASLEEGRHPAWLRAIRKSGIAYFADAGYPSVHQEEWRFTSLEPLRGLPFEPLITPPPIVDGASVESLALIQNSHSRLVFVDGHFAAQLSRLGGEGITLLSLKQALRIELPGLENHLARHARVEEDPFVALNTAFFQDGAMIQVFPGARIEDPVELLFISTTPVRGAAVHPRNLILVGAGGSVKVIEHYVSTGGQAALTSAVTEAVLAEGALLEHCKVQGESEDTFHMGTVQVHQAARSICKSHSISLGSRLARTNIHFVLAGQETESLMNGLYMADGDRLVDHHTSIDHAQPHCVSHEYYNGILGGSARGVFNGKILVRKDAQKTDARQTNRNLLLSDAATIDTKPQLEIFADDVKCTHGATVGQLDDEAIFYMRARGIGQHEARRMLIQAFAGEILERITMDGVRQSLGEKVYQVLSHPGFTEGGRH